jgi:hypothetical protein
MRGDEHVEAKSAEYPCQAGELLTRLFFSCESLTGVLCLSILCLTILNGILFDNAIKPIIPEESERGRISIIYYIKS